MNKKEILKNLKRTMTNCIIAENDKNHPYRKYIHSFCYGMLKECVRSILREETGMIDIKPAMPPCREGV